MSENTILQASNDVALSISELRLIVSGNWAGSRVYTANGRIYSGDNRPALVHSKTSTRTDEMVVQLPCRI